MTRPISTLLCLLVPVHPWLASKPVLNIFDPISAGRLARAASWGVWAYKEPPLILQPLSGWSESWGFSLQYQKYSISPVGLPHFFEPQEFTLISSYSFI